MGHALLNQQGCRFKKRLAKDTIFNILGLAHRKAPKHLKNGVEVTTVLTPPPENIHKKALTRRKNHVTVASVG